MLKKLILPMILAALAIPGCGKKGGDGADAGGGAKTGAGERVIAASFYPMHIAALNITENVPGIRLVNMAPASAGCMHDYQLTPADAMLIEKAEVLIVNGGGMEAFSDKAFALNKKLTIIDASADLGLDDDDGDGRHHHNNDHHHAGNDAGKSAHAWMSVESHIRQIRTIAKHLSSWDAANAGAYTENARKYIADLTTLKESSARELSSINDSSRKIVVSHDGFLSLAREFGLTVAAVIEREHGAEPGAADLVAVVNTVKRAKPKAIFVDGARASPSSKAVSAETGLPVFELDLIVSGPPERGAYVRAMMKNALTLKEALE